MTLQDSKKDMYRTLLNYSALGLEMGFCVVIGLVAGFYADKYLGTYPYLTFVFMIFGMIAAFKAVYRAYKRLKKEDDEGDYRNPG
ncbi:MAG: putative F0F1-ATPase [Syntrophorhabdus sp. PtaB.Bin184]|jgi:ATP synthase protein I|nr:MAG: putative F0F1-ATPase [Syntrophorhabdus sp. PtaB.Bin184]